MNKLKAFNQAVLDIDFADSVITDLSVRIQEINTIEIGSTITLKSGSTTKQFIYGVSILTNQISACEELGIDPTEYKQMKSNAIELKGLVEELDNWRRFLYSLRDYKSEVFELLDEKERFQLLQYPTKP
jgi:hypothetical protein